MNRYGFKGIYLYVFAKTQDLKLFWTEPATVVTGYYQKKEGGRDASNNTKYPEKNAINSSSQLTPLDDNSLADFSKLLPVDEVAYKTLLICGHVKLA